MYNIRINSYSIQGHFEDGLRLLKEMEHMNCAPTLWTITTLIHGAGIGHNMKKAQELLDEIRDRNLVPDSATRVINEMEVNNILPDHITFHTMFSGLINSIGINGVLPLYHQMIGKNFVLKTPTVVMLMTLFCKNREVNETLGFWRYLIERGYCPHGHAVDVLLKSLCSDGRVEESFQCGYRFLKKGERCLLEMGDEVRLKKLDKMIKKLQIVVFGFLGQDMRTDLASERKTASSHWLRCTLLKGVNISQQYVAQGHQRP
ncbi:Pentatricopeptide repeat-containing protein [Artemisia annua]|uniref:Pentatricopeptide repeat-containing protein n=1 Tax=Artemisia annua TaxID=35608 RepID=A0A2U1QHV9_ARTAN|nr:Pentatricopeptide repeat-containing protein [Artemisia annua]